MSVEICRDRLREHAQ